MPTASILLPNSRIQKNRLQVNLGSVIPDVVETIDQSVKRRALTKAELGRFSRPLARVVGSTSSPPGPASAERISAS